MGKWLAISPTGCRLWFEFSNAVLFDEPVRTSTRGRKVLIFARAVDGYLGKKAEVEWTEVVGSLRVQ